MFVDEVSIRTKAGKGGDGCVSFRRERYIPRGGPDGGNGGQGGSVILRADRNTGTLLALRRTREYTAENGRAGEGGNRTGASGKDLVIPVPKGTLARHAVTGELLCDLVEDGQKAVIARGGRGGRGNKSFATPTHQTPREFTYGESGEERPLDLELKLIADVGLVGLPNAGKSTIVSRLSSATPKVANYPFTTLSPCLGLVRGEGFQSLVMADIPGLIEGAHKGAGLGHEFLRHIERTQILAHVIDLAPLDESDPLANLHAIEEELAAFSPALGERPRVLAGNKIDLPGATAAAERIEKETGRTVVRLSAVSGEGLDRLAAVLFNMLARG
jgi:GTPase